MPADPDTDARSAHRDRSAEPGRAEQARGTEAVSGGSAKAAAVTGVAEVTRVTGVAEIPAARLAGEVGRRDLAELEPHRLLLSSVVADLAQAAGHRWSWGSEDPVNALVRALGRLAVEAPETASSHGYRLLEAMART